MKLLVVIEVEAASEAEAQSKFDSFREAVQPGSEYGVSMYRATVEDVFQFNLVARPFCSLIEPSVRAGRI